MVTLYKKEVGSERLGKIKNLLAAYPYLLRHHIRSGCLCNTGKDIAEEFKFVLQEPRTPVVDARYEGDKSLDGSDNDEKMPPFRQCWVDRRDLPWSLLDSGAALAKVAQSQNRPLWVCDRLGKEIMQIPYTSNYSSRERLNLLGTVDKLNNAIGECERIHQTAVPLNYARHSLRSLTIFLVTLPFCFVKDLGLLTGPVTGMIAWLLFGVYQIGHSIEDPFQKSLRLSILCDAIRRDVLGNSARDSAYYLDEDDDFVQDCEFETVLWKSQRDFALDTTALLPKKDQIDMQKVLSEQLVPQEIKGDTWKIVSP
jgi:hypothetical protein